ncbi:MAG: hypothetical protein AABP62_15855 [Planctomycetota bacterium]
MAEEKPAPVDPPSVAVPAEQVDVRPMRNNYDPKFVEERLKSYKHDLWLDVERLEKRRPALKHNLPLFPQFATETDYLRHWLVIPDTVGKTDCTIDKWHPLILEYCRTLGADAKAVDRLFQRIVEGELSNERAVALDAEQAFTELDIAIKCAHQQWLSEVQNIRNTSATPAPMMSNLHHAYDAGGGFEYEGAAVTRNKTEIDGTFDLLYAHFDIERVEALSRVTDGNGRVEIDDSFGLLKHQWFYLRLVYMGLFVIEDESWWRQTSQAAAQMMGLGAFWEEKLSPERLQRFTVHKDPVSYGRLNRVSYAEVFRSIIQAAQRKLQSCKLTGPLAPQFHENPFEVETQHFDEAGCQKLRSEIEGVLPVSLTTTPPATSPSGAKPDDDSGTVPQHLIQRRESRRADSIKRLAALHSESTIEEIYLSQRVNRHGLAEGKPEIRYIRRANKEWPGDDCHALWKESCSLVTGGAFDVEAADGGLSSWLFGRTQQFWSPTGINAVVVDPLREWLDALRSPNQGDQQPMCCVIVPGNPEKAQPFHLAAVANKADFVARVLRKQHEETEKVRERIWRDQKYLRERTEASGPFEIDLISHIKGRSHELREDERTWRLWTGYADIVRHYASALMPDELAKCREISQRVWQRPQEAKWDELEREFDLLASKFQWYKLNEQSISTGAKMTAAERRDKLCSHLFGFGDGLYLTDLPSELVDLDLLTVMNADGVIEFGRRISVHAGPEGDNTLYLEGLEFFDLTGKRGRKFAADCLADAIAGKVEHPELRLRVRLTTDKGEVEACRVRLQERDTAKDSETETLAGGTGGKTLGKAGAARKSVEPSGEEPKAQRCQILAYYASRYAEWKVERKLLAQEVYDYWKDEGFDSADKDTENAAELAEYQLPDSFETFKTHLSKGRSAFNDRRNEDRKGRKGRSIVSDDGID